ncbi:hypothetical protein SmJEL517_g02961 [Synchytrium microbalum]|uniref:Uncharacterized protein n=1 Tax=Synchytrium microbalum TaxID=1806994 RepID=A0A507BYG9_9FUNG|nr:uncharacterized protein SmJEL517_g02961 [Synchytrium microbalum]TPX34350.1 hypothetical protein SmJEL517_g02961 [Synchytrium microbalum]
MSDTVVLWIQLFKRNSDRANDQSAAVEELGDAIEVGVNDTHVTNISNLRKYLINHGRFKKSLDGVKPDQLYVYMDAECKTPLHADTSITQIETSDDNPLRVVRPAPPQVGEFDTATTTLSPLSFTVIKLKDLMDKYESQGLLGLFPLFINRSAPKLLVNREYCLLHEFLKRISAEGIVKEGMTSRAIVGNPGIALQNELSCYYYFDHSGVVMNAPSRTCPSDIGNPTWALVDSNQYVVIPCIGLIGNSQVLVVQATSPKVERYREWTKQADALLYYMNTWTWEEAAFYGSEVLHLNMNRIWEAWNDWNPCPRYCFSIAKSKYRLESYQRSVVKSLRVNRQNLLPLVLSGSSANAQEASKLILISGVEVRTAEDWSLGRMDFKVEIIGKQVIRMMSDKIETRSEVDRRSFYEMLGRTSGEAAVRGMMLQARMHRLMSKEGPPLNATCLTDRSELLVAPTEKVVRFMKTDLSAMLKDKESGYFWPIASNYASFDGFIWDRKTSIIILLQATVSAVHPIKQSGFEELLKAFRDAGLRTPEYPWPLVFCTSINALAIQTTQQVQGVWNTRLTQYILKI